ncbi:MAG: hypothetical protein GWN54_13170, partial [Gammaproteobacteria bacterium]|nr:hypothetical protein [Gammaproteobacteria bacterium]
MRTLSLSALVLMLLILATGCQPGDREAGAMGKGALRLGAVLGEPDQQGFARAEAVVPIAFPR